MAALMILFCCRHFDLETLNTVILWTLHYAMADVVSYLAYCLWELLVEKQRNPSDNPSLSIQLVNNERLRSNYRGHF